ncbi:MAG: hydrogenase maturation nickel metallochaperone HypA [Gammaproteobacteria bacterium]
MHELSVCRSLMTQLETIMDEHQAAGIERVSLQIGPLAGIEPQLLKQAFPIASRDTRAEGAELAIEAVAIRIRCQGCGEESEARINDLSCPSCRHGQTQLLSGDEMLLHSVELKLAPANQGGPHV